MAHLDDDLTRIDKVVKDRTLIERIRTYNNFEKIYRIAHNFIIEKELLVFGGYALNSILPQEDRFYDEYELPDFDLLSTDPEQDVKELSSEYQKQGYKYIEVRDAMLPRIYTLFVEFMPIADFRFIPKSLFSKLTYISNKEKVLFTNNNPDLKIKIVPLDFMRRDVHHEISEPHGQVSRWRKVYERFLLIHKAYPYHYDAQCITKNGGLIKSYTQLSHKQALDFLLKYINDRGYPHVGTSGLYNVLKMLSYKLKPYAYIDESVGAIEILSDMALETAQTLQNSLKTKFPTQTFTLKSYGVRSIYLHDVPFHTIFINKRHALVTIHQTKSCHSIIKIENVKIGNIDTQLNYLYNYILNSVSPEVDEKRKCMINMLYNIVYDPKYSRKLVSTRFNLDCYGYQPSLDSAKRIKKTRLKNSLKNK